MTKLRLALLSSALAFVTVPGCRAPRDGQFNFMLAYGQVEMEEREGLEPVVNDQGGGRFAIGFDTLVHPTSDNGSGARLGGRFIYSIYREDVGDRIVAEEPLLEIEDFVDLDLFTPQFSASYRQVLGNRRRGGFIEPGVGLGVSIGVLSFGSEFQFDDQPLGTTYDDSEVELGVSVNPFLRGGMSFGRYLIGAEGGYQWTMLEFDDALGADPREWYLGLFFAMRVGE